MSDNRRDFLKKGALLSLSGLASSLLGNEKIQTLENASGFFSAAPAFVLPALPYAYNALEPYIDAQTMQIHHDKHHQAYIDKLNTVTEGIDLKAEDEMKCKQVDSATPALIRNNLGGYYNHSLFWTLLKPNAGGEANPAFGKLASAITKDFGSFDAFKKQFSESAAKIFGSGWCWLILKDNTLKITTTPNQDNPLMKVAADQGSILLCLDVWEHAYYLKYQNKRADYIAGWWNIVNWDKAEELFSKVSR